MLVLGQVARPGPLALHLPGDRVGDALHRAGGTTALARGGVVLTRRCADGSTRSWRLDPEQQDPPLGAGDGVFVNGGDE